MAFAAPKKKKVEAEDSPTPVKLENEQVSKMDFCSPNQGQISGSNAVSESDEGSAKTARVLMESRENMVVIKHGDSKPSVEEEPNSVGGAVTREKSAPSEKKSAKLDVDFQDLTVTKA